MPSELIGTTHVSTAGGRLAIIEVSRDEQSSQPTIWLKVATADIEYENVASRITNYTIDLERTPIPLDEAGLRERLDSMVEDGAVVSEAILAVRKLLAAAGRANVPTLRAEARDSERPTLIADEPPTMVGRTREK